MTKKINNLLGLVESELNKKILEKKIELKDEERE